MTTYTLRTSNSLKYGTLTDFKWTPPEESLPGAVYKGQMSARGKVVPCAQQGTN